MKQLFYLIAILLCCISCKHDKEVFDCELFSFSYPLSYKTAKFDKGHTSFWAIESDNKLLVVGWGSDQDIDDDITIWDDFLYDYYKSDPKVVDVERIILKTKNKEIQCLKIKSKTHSPILGNAYDKPKITYLILHKSIVLQFLFSSKENCSFNHLSFVGDKLMEGLKLNN